MKCLEKERGRRYETASGLAADVLRHLEGEPVVAAPPSAAYRLRKFARRHRVGVAAGTAVALALLLGVIGTTAGLVWAVREARRAVSQRDKAEQIAGFISTILEGVGPSVARGRDTGMLKELMDDAANKIERGELRDSPEAEVQLRLTIGRAYRALAAYDAAERMLGPLLNLSRAAFGPEHEGVAAALVEHAALLLAQGKDAESLAENEEALAMLRRLFTGDREAVAEGLNAVAASLLALGREKDALPRYQAALDMQKRLHPGERDAPPAAGRVIPAADTGSP